MLQGLPHCGQRAVLPYLYYTVSLRIRTKVENNVVPLLAGVKGLKLPLALQRFPIALVYATVSCIERAHTQPYELSASVGLALGKKKSQPEGWLFSLWCGLTNLCSATGGLLGGLDFVACLGANAYRIGENSVLALVAKTLRHSRHYLKRLGVCLGVLYADISEALCLNLQVSESD